MSRALTAIQEIHPLVIVFPDAVVSGGTKETDQENPSAATDAVFERAVFAEKCERVRHGKFERGTQKADTA
jgi:hypothetical protein